MGWQQQVRAAVIRYVIAQGNLVVLTGPPNAKEFTRIQRHMKTCRPDFAASWFEDYRWTVDDRETFDECFHTHEEHGLAASITCLCGEVRDARWELREFSYVDLLNAVTAPQPPAGYRVWVPKEQA
jgi:hypothetical protein